MSKTLTRLAAAAATCLAVAGGLAIAQTTSTDSARNPGPTAGPNAGAPADSGTTQSGSTATGTSPSSNSAAQSNNGMRDGTMGSSATNNTSSPTDSNGMSVTDDSRQARRDRN